MNLLIKLIAAGLSRIIEKGSPVGAIIGALVMIAIALLITWYLYLQGVVDRYVVACALVLVMPGWILGAIIGGRIGPKPSPADSRGSMNVCLTNFNRGLIPAFLALLPFAFALLILFSPHKPEDLQIIWGSVAAGVILLVVGTRPILWVDISSRITLHRMLGATCYESRQIQNWAILVPRDQDSIDSPQYDATVWIDFTDGRRIQLPVPARKIASLQTVMSRLKPVHN